MGSSRRQSDFQQELRQLKQEVTALTEKAEQLAVRIDRSKTDTGASARSCAVVSASKCTGCGMCEEVCRVGAIRTTYVARVNRDACIGCGLCVEHCPQGAIRLRKA